MYIHQFTWITEIVFSQLKRFCHCLILWKEHLNAVSYIDVLKYCTTDRNVILHHVYWFRSHRP